MAYFSKIRIKKPRRHLFNLSHEHLTTFNMGELIPIYWEETLPGDKFSVGVESFLRFMPLISPVMHRINLRFYAFFVPNRLFGQEAWESFITGGSEGSYNYPLTFTINFPNGGVVTNASRFNRLFDYLGYVKYQSAENAPNTLRFPKGFNAFPFFAYFKIWNDYFRDQNLQPEATFNSNPDLGAYGMDLSDLDAKDYVSSRGGILMKCWEKDYFTSALPWLQRGNPADLPISFANTDITTVLTDKPNQEGLELTVAEGATPSGSSHEPWIIGQGTDQSPYTLSSDGNTSPNKLQPRNLSDFLVAESTMDDIEASFTINDLRRAEALQRWMEKSARGGSRYIEQIRSFFGVTSSDARLQRPEFLGALSSPVSVSEVLQHSQTTADGTPLGEMGGHALSAAGNWIFRNKFFEEHGTIMILACVQPRTAYYGPHCDRRFYKPDRFHFYWPDFARIGEQPVFNGELYANPNPKTIPINVDGLMGDVFGYQERYSEYKQRLSRISGDFESTLDFWHLGRSFDSSVALNKDFVQCNPSSRVFAVEDGNTQKLLGDFFLKVKAFRPVIPHVIPGL